MSVVEIPILAGFDWFTESVSLDGTDYQVELHWNTRDSRWRLSLADAAGDALVAGIPLVVDWPLLSQFVSGSLPPGEIVALDTSGRGEEISAIEELGDRVRLYYVPEADLG
jgi:hypothetical protein